MANTQTAINDGGQSILISSIDDAKRYGLPLVLANGTHSVGGKLYNIQIPQGGTSSGYSNSKSNVNPGKGGNYEGNMNTSGAYPQGNSGYGYGYSYQGGGGAPYPYDQLSAYMQQAYDSNMNALNSSYAQREAYLRGNYENSLADMMRQNELATGRVNQNTDRALQEAYIGRMQAERDLPQMLAAQGISGGMSESTLAGLLSTYGNNRSQLELGRGESLSELENALLGSKSELMQAYNSAMSADARERMLQEQQLINALASGQMGLLQDKYAADAAAGANSIRAAGSAYSNEANRIAKESAEYQNSLNTLVSNALKNSIQDDNSVNPALFSNYLKSMYDSGQVTAQMLEDALAQSVGILQGSMRKGGSPYKNGLGTSAGAGGTLY